MPGVRLPHFGYHTGTRPEATADMTTHTAALPHTAQAAREARTEVARLLSGRCSPPAIDTAALLTSELVTNAVLHASPPVQLRVEITAGFLRVEIHDSSTSTLPAPSLARSTERNGRGLAIVEALASRWGSEHTIGGKFVWFELRAGSDTLDQPPRSQPPRASS
jgi:anti-sigma regulatory factor (Ser/Thr protein kinase)